MSEAQDRAARDAVAQACRILKANGHDDYVWGHVSVRDASGRGLWMKPSGLGFEEVAEEDVILVGFDGEVLSEQGNRHAEWPIHATILSENPHLSAVVHTHPPYSIALGASSAPLRPISHAGTLFTPPGVPRFDLTSNLIVTPELGAAVARTLGESRAIFMVNHGIVTAGETMQEAVARAVLLEKACQQQLLAEQMGVPFTWTDDDAALEKRAFVWPPAHFDALWDYFVRTSSSGQERTTPRRSPNGQEAWR